MARASYLYGAMEEESQGLWPLRATVRGTRHVAVAGHYLAAQAGFLVLEGGGNAVDAGVAAGLVEQVVESDQVNFAGVAPILIYLAERREVVSLAGLGHWPRAASCDYFVQEHGGSIPDGILRTVVPAAPAAWLAALERYGTMSFGEVAAAAIRLAREGFPLHPYTAAEIRRHAEFYARWPGNAAVYLPDGAPPQPASRFVQADLARTLQYLADEEAAAARGGREAGLRAAHAAFYEGDVAQRIVAHSRERGGFLAAEDLAGFRVPEEPPERTRFHDLEVVTCGFWSQGPVLLQMLNLLEGFDLAALGHNSVAYVHALTEAIKLAFADRHWYYGDPAFVDVPRARLLDKGYAAERRQRIDPERAWPELPPPGDAGMALPAIRPPVPSEPAAAPLPALDTSYVCTADAQGNVFTVSPSDPSYDMELVPGTGLCPSSRGAQSWADPAHPSSVAPGKRPRLTPMPALALREGRPWLVWGTPGGDVQAQAMLQVLLNIRLFGMDPQKAVEAPRFVSRSHPDSFEPHAYFPGQLNLEGALPPELAPALERLGHRVQPWPERTVRAGGVCAIQFDGERGIFHAGADCRRAGAAVGW